MRKLLTQSIPLVTSLFGIVIWYLSFQCIYKDCAIETILLKISDTVIRPFGLFFLFSLIGTFLLILVPKQDYKGTLKFAVVWLLASLILISITDTYAASFLPIVTKTHIAVLLGSLFSFVLAIITIRRYFLSKK